MRVFVIIPVHDHVEATLHCLDCLSRQAHSEWTAIVVDDGSTDGTAQAVTTRFPQTLVLDGDGGLWWAGASNRGIDFARQTAAPDDLVLLLNNDTSFDPDYLANLVQTCIANNRALTGSLNVALDDRAHEIDTGVSWDWAAIRSRQVPISQDAAAGMPINTLSGRGLLIPVEIFARVGTLAARALPHYYADYEFSQRAHRAGFPLAVSPRAVLQVRTNITGREENLNTPVTLRDVWFLLFSRKSIRNVHDRLQFVSLACPREYRWRNRIAILAASAWLVTNVTPLFQIKQKLFQLLAPKRLRAWMTERRLLKPMQ